VTNDDRLMALWTTEGLRSEGIGPQVEWSPVTAEVFQKRHNAFWSAISGIIPDDEHDEPYWMTQNASNQLLRNHN
jgi:hypothetical protein